MKQYNEALNQNKKPVNQQMRLFDKGHVITLFVIFLFFYYSRRLTEKIDPREQQIKEEVFCLHQQYFNKSKHTQERGDRFFYSPCMLYIFIVYTV